MDSFKSMIPEKAQVLRNGGQIEEVDVWELVPGDICGNRRIDQSPLPVELIAP